MLTESSRTASGDFLNLEVNKGEFYLSELMSEIKASTPTSSAC